MFQCFIQCVVGQNERIVSEKKWKKKEKEKNKAEALFLGRWKMFVGQTVRRTNWT
jgi:hypothetical protein